jgi:hypothetical protein
MGDARLALDHAISAIEAYEESVAIRRRLIELDGSNTQWPEEVSYILKKIEHAKRAHEEHSMIDQHFIEFEPATTVRAEKESASPSGEEVIAYARHLLLSFFALSQWRVTKRARAAVRSFQRASRVRESRPKELKPQESVTASHKNESSIQGDGDGVSAIAVLSGDSVPNTADAEASDRASIKKRHHRGRRRKRKGQHNDMQHCPPSKH